MCYTEILNVVYLNMMHMSIKSVAKTGGRRCGGVPVMFGNFGS